MKIPLNILAFLPPTPIDGNAALSYAYYSAKDRRVVACNGTSVVVLSGDDSAPSTDAWFDAALIDQAKVSGATHVELAESDGQPVLNEVECPVSCPVEGMVYPDLSQIQALPRGAEVRLDASFLAAMAASAAITVVFPASAGAPVRIEGSSESGEVTSQAFVMPIEVQGATGPAPDSTVTERSVNTATDTGKGKRRTAPAANDDTPLAATVRHNADKGGVEIVFNRKPDKGAQPTVSALMKANGFRFSGRQQLWYAKQTPERDAFATHFAANLDQLIGAAA